MQDDVDVLTNHIGIGIYLFQRARASTGTPREVLTSGLSTCALKATACTCTGLQFIQIDRFFS